MREAYGDLFKLAAGKVIVITTNGDVKKNGEAVMGRGCAAEAKRRWPHMPLLLGSRLEALGNRVHRFVPMEDSYGAIVTFPVKHHWSDKADLKLIRESAHELVKLTDSFDWKDVYVP